MRTQSPFNGVIDRMLTIQRTMDEALGLAAGEGDARRVVWLPSLDVTETENAYVVEADLPGVDPKDVDISFERNVLTIKGSRSLARRSEESERRVRSAERMSGTFVRSVRLPDHVDGEQIEASYEHGVLTITVPKPATALPRKIPVRVAAEPRRIEG